MTEKISSSWHKVIPGGEPTKVDVIMFAQM